jgi:hypothetical protein
VPGLVFLLDLEEIFDFHASYSLRPYEGPLRFTAYLKYI